MDDAEIVGEHAGRQTVNADTERNDRGCNNGDPNEQRRNATLDRRPDDEREAKLRLGQRERQQRSTPRGAAPGQANGRQTRGHRQQDKLPIAHADSERRPREEQPHGASERRTLVDGESCEAEPRDDYTKRRVQQHPQRR